MPKENYGRMGLIALLLSAIAATGVLAELRTPAFAHQEHTEFITNAEYVKGHLEQVIANKQAGNTSLAIAHAGHPIEEVFTLMKGPLEEASPQRAADLQAALESLPTSVEPSTVESLTQSVNEIYGMLDEAVQVYAGEEATTLETRAGVIKGLVGTAGVEYSEAVEDGMIIEMIEYQDASAFISRANATFAAIQSELPSHEAEELVTLFRQLDENLASKADPADVQTLLDGVVHELDEAVPSTDEDAEFAANLAYIRGHLAQALANRQAGNAELAAAHAGHPVNEVYSLIKAELSENDQELDGELEQGLTTFANEVVNLNPEQVQSQVADLNMLLDQAESTVIAETERNDPRFNAMVAIAVLETAEHEYQEAVEDGQIVEMVEYQDSTAFIAQAKDIFTSSIEGGMPEEEAEEVGEFFEVLDSLTGSNASFEQVETTIGGIVHEFEEVFSLAEEVAYDGQAYIDKIIELLDESVAAYQAGDAEEAEALAVEAYLENYEYIETDIKEDDPELMVKIELDMRQELVDMIKQGRPATEVQDHVNTIKADLETARAVVVPEFPLPILAIATTMVVAVIVARLRGIWSLKRQ